MKFDKSKFLAPSSIAGPFGLDGFGDVYVREVPYSDAGFVYEAGEDADAMEVTARIIVVSVCDKSGDLLFDRDDLDMLRATPAMRLQRLMELVNEHSGFGADAEEIAGNLQTTT